MGAVPVFSKNRGAPMMSNAFDRIHTVARAYGLSLIYLFGSQAITGNQYLNGIEIVPDGLSDLDIAVAFQNPPTLPMETYGHLYRDMGKIFDPFDIDLIFVHEVDILLQYEIIKGERIYEAGESLADQFEESIMKQAGDLMVKKLIMDREIMEAIEDGYFQFEYTPHS
jgi:predicted nucleotidyltransferase